MSCNYAEGLSPYEHKGVLGIPEKFESIERFNKKCELLAQFISQSKHVVVHTGAGISTSAGIPDFRGPNGVWTLEKEGKKPTINISFTDAKPTKTHMILKKLVECKKVHYVVSQNIDGLHLKSGLPRKYLAELHGNMFIDECNVCHRQFVRNCPVETVGKKCSGVPCASQHAGGRPCRGRLYDGVLDWEHKLPENDLLMAEWHSSIADLSICLGTTLQIVPSGNLPLQTAKYGGQLVICNLQPTKHDNKADLIIHYYVDDILEKVMNILGIDIPTYEEAEDFTKQAESSIIDWTIARQDVLALEKVFKSKCQGVKKIRSLIKNKRNSHELDLDDDLDDKSKLFKLNKRITRSYYKNKGKKEAKKRGRRKKEQCVNIANVTNGEPIKTENVIKTEKCVTESNDTDLDSNTMEETGIIGEKSTVDDISIDGESGMVLDIHTIDGNSMLEVIATNSEDSTVEGISTKCIDSILADNDQHCMVVDIFKCDKNNKVEDIAGKDDNSMAVDIVTTGENGVVKDITIATNSETSKLEEFASKTESNKVEDITDGDQNSMVVDNISMDGIVAENGGIESNNTSDEKEYNCITETYTNDDKIVTECNPVGNVINLKSIADSSEIKDNVTNKNTETVDFTIMVGNINTSKCDQRYESGNDVSDKRFVPNFNYISHAKKGSENQDSSDQIFVFDNNVKGGEKCETENKDTSDGICLGNVKGGDICVAKDNMIIGINATDTIISNDERIVSKHHLADSIKGISENDGTNFRIVDTNANDNIISNSKRFVSEHHFTDSLKGTSENDGTNCQINDDAEYVGKPVTDVTNYETKTEPSELDR